MRLNVEVTISVRICGYKFECTKRVSLLRNSVFCSRFVGDKGDVIIYSLD